MADNCRAGPDGNGSASSQTTASASLPNLKQTTNQNTRLVLYYIPQPPGIVVAVQSVEDSSCGLRTCDHSHISLAR